MNRKSKVIATAITALIVLAVTALYAQDKYLLKSPGGIAFFDFRGYEDWSVVSPARTNEVLKVIVANPTWLMRTRPPLRATASLSQMAP